MHNRKEWQIMNHTDNLLQFINGYKLSNALFIAAELKIFDYIDGVNSVETISNQLSVDPKALEIILDVFCSMNLIRKSDDKKYILEAQWKPLLDSRSKSSMISLIQLEHYLSTNHSGKDRFKDVLKSGRGSDDLNLNAKEGKENVYGCVMDAGGQYSSVCIAREFNKVKKGTILDVGGGMGTHAIKICQFNPQLNIDIVDKAEMKEQCIKNIKEHGMEDRIHFLTGDIRDISLEKKYDGILESNVLHLFSDKINQKLLVKLASALHKGGILIMHDFFLSEDKAKRPVSSIYTLDWMMQGSFFHAEAQDIKQWVEAVGLEFIKEVQYERIPTSIIITKKI